MQRSRSAPDRSGPLRRTRVTFSKHGALEGDRQLAVISCAMQREVMVNRLIDILCQARVGRVKLGSAFVAAQFEEAERVVDALRDQTVALVDAVRFWQQAYVEAPPFRFDRHPNYLTHVIVSLDFVASFPAFRKRLNCDGRRNPFMIPNSRPSAAKELARFSKFHEYHQALLRLEAKGGPAEVPKRKKVLECLEAGAAEEEAMAKKKDAAAAAAALRKRKRQQERYLAKIAAKERENIERREASAKRNATLREELEERARLRGEILREQEQEELAKERQLLEQQKSKQKELRRQRLQATRLREKAAQKSAAVRAEERRKAQLIEETKKLRAQQLRKATIAAKKESAALAKEDMERRKDAMRRFAERARLERIEQNKAHDKMQRKKILRAQKTMALVEERKAQREHDQAEARAARELAAAQRRSDEINRVAAAAMKGDSENNQHSKMQRGAGSAASRIASYSKSIQILGKRKSALAAAERQLAAMRKRREDALRACDDDAVRKAELSFDALQEAVEKQRRSVLEVEHELQEWGGKLKPILSGAGALRSSSLDNESVGEGTVDSVQMSGPEVDTSTSMAARRHRTHGGRTHYRNGSTGSGQSSSSSKAGAKRGKRRNIKKKKKNKKVAPNIGSLLLADADEASSDEEDFEADCFDSDDDEEDGNGEVRIAAEDSIHTKRNGASPTADRKLYEEATSWETTYSNMVITPHMRAVSREAGSSSAEQRKTSSGGSGDSRQKLGREDLVRIGMEAALKLPPIAPAPATTQSSRSDHDQHLLQPTEKEKKEWHAKYGKAMALDAVPVSLDDGGG